MSKTFWWLYGGTLAFAVAALIWLGMNYAHTHNPVNLVTMGLVTFITLQIASTPFR